VYANIAFVFAWLGCGVALAGAPTGTFDPWIMPAKYALECKVDLSPVVKDSARKIEVWLPLPATNDHQRVIKQEIDSAARYRETLDAKGNRMLYIQPQPGSSGASEVSLRFEIERKPFHGVKPAAARQHTPLDPARYMGPQQRIPLDSELHRLADEVAAKANGEPDKIRVFYDHVVRTLRYDKSGKGWGHGDVKWACSAKRGNCTDFHSLFIGLARCEKIPARFVIGFPIPADKAAGTIGGYHCWAEAFDDQHGWRPVDASEAWKAKNPDAYFAHLPSDRVEFTVGRDLVLEPPQQGAPLNYFIKPYAEVDGKSVDKLAWDIRFQRVEPVSKEQ
jgi:transglutaminase-like putative cysteine protease